MTTEFRDIDTDQMQAVLYYSRKRRRVFQQSVGANPDPHWDNVVLLVNFDNEEDVGNKVAIDVSPQEHIFTWTGAQTRIDATDPPPWQAVSMKGNGGFPNCTTPNHEDFLFGTGDFTVEAYVRHRVTVSDAILTMWDTGPNVSWFWAHDGSPNEFLFHFSEDGTNNDGPITATGTMALNTWTHVAVSRVDNFLYHCENKVITKVTAFNFDLWPSTGTKLAIASNNGGNSFWDGQLANVRITKGVGRYSGSVSSPYTINALGPNP